jgi:CheY-like chemotaxis protein
MYSSEGLPSILLVDDDPHVVVGLAAILRKSGFACHTAVDGEEALHKLTRTIPDVMICDLNMPNLSGFDLLSIARRRFPDINIIVISGDFRLGSAPSEILLGAAFEKGQYHPEDLVATVRQLHLRRPTRQVRPRSGLAPLWLDRQDETFLVTTCSGCLCTFPVKSASSKDLGLNSVRCPACGAVVTYSVSTLIGQVLRPLRVWKSGTLG